MCNSTCFIRCGFCHCQLSSMCLCEPSLASEGCYLFCHAHTSAAHREEVSMQVTWLIEGTGHRGALCTAMVALNTKDVSQETLLSASLPLEVMNRSFLHSSHIINISYLDFLYLCRSQKFIFRFPSHRTQ